MQVQERRGSAPRRTDEGSVRTEHSRRTKADLIGAGARVFAEKGLTGARIGEIAAQARTSKRMIYYYFGSKEGLYRSVLAEAWRRVHRREDRAQASARPPLAALERFVGQLFEQYARNEDFVRLLMVENIHRAEYLRGQPRLAALARRALEPLQAICDRGVAQGVIRPDVDPLDLYMTATALCVFPVSNRHTFSAIFAADLSSRQARRRRRREVVEAVLRAAAAPAEAIRITACRSIDSRG